MDLVFPIEDYERLGYWKIQNIYHYLEKSANKFPDKIAVVDRDGSYTYKELHEKVKELAGTLKSLGINKGDIVSFQLPNWVESMVVHYATAMLGAICNPIGAIHRSKEVKFILNQSKTKVFIIPFIFRKFNYLEMVNDIKEELSYLEKVVVVNKYQEEVALDDVTELAYDNCFNIGNEIHEAVKITDSDPVLLMYTSGTTSDPKGAVHSHPTIIHEVNTMIDLYELNHEDSIFMPSPLTHIAGYINGICLPVMLGSKLVLQDLWNANEAVETIVNENCTFTLGATPFLQGIYQIVKETGRKIPLKVFPCGGADVPPELVIQASKELDCFVTRVYGSTEYPTFLLCGPRDPREKAAYTDGRALDGCKAKILDEEKKELPIGVTGELAVKGPEMFLGYIQSKFNEEAFTEDGYFLTGDLAAVDEDGYYQIKGRKKDIIIRGGENIAVKEVEELLYEHEKIAKVAVVAVPDPQMGEKACAYLELNGETTINLDEVKAFLLDRGIAIQKIPERLEIVEEMPMTTSGKIQKYILRDDIKKKVSEELELK